MPRKYTKKAPEKRKVAHPRARKKSGWKQFWNRYCSM